MRVRGSRTCEREIDNTPVTLHRITPSSPFSPTHSYQLGLAAHNAGDSVESGGSFDFKGFMHAKGVGPILASTSCRFKAASKYPDDLIVGSKIDEADLGEDRFVMQYRVYSKTLDRVLADGDGVIVMFDYEMNKKGRVSEELRRAILAVDARGPEFGFGDMSSIL